MLPFPLPIKSFPFPLPIKIKLFPFPLPMCLKKLKRHFLHYRMHHWVTLCEQLLKTAPQKLKITCVTDLLFYGPKLCAVITAFFQKEQDFLLFRSKLPKTWCGHYRTTALPTTPLKLFPNEYLFTFTFLFSFVQMF